MYRRFKHKVYGKLYKFTATQLHTVFDIELSLAMLKRGV